jgi:hypothetical protein
MTEVEKLARIELLSQEIDANNEENAFYYSEISTLHEEIEEARNAKLQTNLGAN